MKKNEIFTALFIAKKNILKNQGSLIFTVLIISLGFISSIIIYGSLKDTGENIQDAYIETSMGHLVIESYESHELLKDSKSIVKKIFTLKRVQGVAEVTKRTARFYDADGNYVDSEVYVIKPSDFARVSNVDNLIKAGSFLNDGEHGKILTGCINIKSCNNIDSFNRIDVNIGEKIIAVFDLNHQANLSLQGIYDHIFIQAEIISYVTQETAKDIFEDYDPSTSSEIIVSLNSKDDAEQVLEELTKLNIDAKISTWRQKSSKYSSIIDSFLVIGDLSFMIGVIISAISIYVILYINILNKKSQIGIIRALGIRSRVVSLSYVFISSFLGILGSAAGILLTLGMVQYFKINPIITGIGKLIPRVTIKIFLIVSISIILASVISGYLVSKKVIKFNIIESIYNG
jgi:putative ABC transport system permease protein